MVQNATARIGQSRTDAAGERDDVIAHRRVDSIGHAIDAKMSEYSVTDWPRMVRITDSRARMCIFVAVSILHNFLASFLALLDMTVDRPRMSRSGSVRGRGVRGAFAWQFSRLTRRAATIRLARLPEVSSFYLRRRPAPNRKSPARLTSSLVSGIVDSSGSFYGSPRSSATAIVFSGGSAWGGCGVAAQIRLGQRHDGRRWRAWVRTWSGRSRKQECSCP
jgi:hypothetical protein